MDQELTESGGGAWTFEELAAINEVAAAVSEHLDLQAVLEVGLDASLRALKLGKGWIRLYKRAGELEVRAVRGLPEEHVATLQALKEFEGVCGAAVEQGEAVIIHGAPEDPGAIFPALRHHGMSSYMGTPLMLHGKILGILVTASAKPFMFGPRQAALVKVIAAQIAVAIEHALLHEEIERQRQLREEGLREAHASVQATIDSLPARICVLDERGGIVFVNYAWGDYVRQGIAAPECCGLGADYLAVCDQAAREGDSIAEEAARGIRAVLAGESQSFSLDYPCDSPEERRYFQMRAVPLEQPGGRRVVIAHHDVTGIKLAEEETRRALEDLQALDRLKDDFVGGITHDLKTPLVPVKGFLDLLLSGRAGPLTERQRTFLNYCDAAVARQTNMIEDLLESTRIQAGRVRFEPEPLDVREVLSAALQYLALIARDKHLVVEAQLPAEPLRVLGEARKLERVFSNLFSNAVRFNVDGGAVTLRAWAEGERVLVSVADTGIGISPEERQKVFERFYQAPGRRGGAGLGLSVVKEFVRLHGGEIRLESELGKGTTVTVSLPRMA
jgi:signal transduction histidine kinase/putative methionine-R-sulfoxide reductase with GAF domain